MKGALIVPLPKLVAGRTLLLIDDIYDSGKVYGPSNEVELRSIDVQFPLAALYKRTTVPETLDASEDEV